MSSAVCTNTGLRCRLQAVEQTMVIVLMFHREERKDGPIAEGLGLLSVSFGDTFFRARLFLRVSAVLRFPACIARACPPPGEGKSCRPGSVAAREEPSPGAVSHIDFSRLRRGSRRWNGEQYELLVDSPPACFSLPHWSVRNPFFFEFPARTVL